MKDICISVVIPVYNCEKTLKRCIDSILAQTIIDKIEIIMVNDGSSDSSFEVMNDYYNKYPETIRILSQYNRGQSVARNLGINLATGKYVGFVDGDDYINNCFYEKMLELMDESTDLVISKRYNSNQLNEKYEKRPKEEINNCSIRDNKKALSKTSTFVCDKLFKLSVIKKGNIYFPEKYRYAEDLYFLVIYKYYSGKMKISNESVYFYRKKSDSITNSCDIRWMDICKVLGEIQLFFVERNCFSEYAEELLNITIGFYCRRIKVMKVTGKKHIQILFVIKMINYLKKNYPSKWRRMLDDYQIKTCKRIRKSRILMCLYIVIPNEFKR